MRLHEGGLLALTFIMGSITAVDIGGLPAKIRVGQSNEEYPERPSKERTTVLVAP